MVTQQVAEKPPTKKSKHKPRSFHKQPLTPAQQQLIVDNDRLMWKLARDLTPRSLRRQHWAIEESYDVILEGAILAARTFDEAKNVTFGYYGFTYAPLRVFDYWRKRQRLHLLSLNAPLNSDGESGLEETVMNPNDEPPKAEDEDGTITQLREAMRFLPSRYRDAISRAFGLNNGTPVSQLELAQEMGISRQRIHQIIEKALAQLREELDARGVTYGD